MLRLLLLFWLALSATEARAQRASDVSWQPQWDRLSELQYLYLAILAPAEAYLEYGPVRSSGEPRLKGPWPGDGLVRDLVRVGDPDARRDIDVVTDWLWWPTLAFPLYADALGSALIAHGEAETAWQLTGISLQALLTVTFVSRLMHVTLRRQRPVYYQAEQEGVEAEAGVAETLSLPGGHAATSFAGAGLACSFHRHLPLFGGGLADDLACGAVLAVAGLNSMLRVAIDRHYFSDTLIGAALGFVVGYFTPELLHFATTPDAVAPVVVPRVDAEGASLTVRVML